MADVEHHERSKPAIHCHVATALCLENSTSWARGPLREVHYAYVTVCLGHCCVRWEPFVARGEAGGKERNGTEFYVYALTAASCTCK